MATNTFSNTSGTNWSTADNWTLGVPDNTHDCVMSAAGLTCNVDATAVCKSLDFTAATSITWSGSAALTISGSLTLKSGMTRTYTGGITFDASGTITSNTVTMASAITINGSGITVSLADALNTSSNITLVSGTFDANEQDITANRMTATGATTRVLDVTGSTLTLSARWDLGTTSTNLTVNMDANTIIILSGSALRFMTMGLTYYDVRITLSSSYCYLYGSPTIDKLTITNTASANTELRFADASSQTLTITDTLSITGNSVINRIYINDTSVGNTVTIICTGATVSYSNCDFEDVTIVDGGTHTASVVGDCGGNTNVAVTTADTWYFKYSGATTTLPISTVAYWFTATNGGGSGATYPPLPQDTMVFDASSLDADGKTISTTYMPRIGSLDFSDVTNTPTFSLSATSTFYGDFKLKTGMSYAGNSDITYRGRGNSTFSTAGIALGTSSVVIDCDDGSITLASAFSLSNEDSLTLTSGTLDIDGQTVTVGTLSSSVTTTRTIQDTAGGGKFVVTGVTGTVVNLATITNLTFSNAPDIDIGNSAVTQTAEITFNTGAITWGDCKISKHAGNYSCLVRGAKTFGSFTIEQADATYQYSSVKFYHGQTFTVTSFVANASADYKPTITSDTTSTFTLSDTAGTNQIYNCTIDYCVVGGGATWLAYTDDGNVNGGHNGTPTWSWAEQTGPSIGKFLGIAAASIGKINGIAFADLKTVSGQGGA
jgi:hypothetical protein